MVKAVIYDMDGVIINTIPLGKKAEHDIFRKRGILIEEEMYKDTIGLRENETIASWCNKYHWQHINQREILQEYIRAYEKEVYENGILMQGVIESLQFFKDKRVKLALASSSFMSQINAVLNTFDLAQYFDVIYSAEYEEYGKPHPGVYITTAKRLQVAPDECLAIEDSLNGIIAAKAARMQCLCIPLAQTANRAFCLADHTRSSLLEINDDFWSMLECSGGVTSPTSQTYTH